jgi:hypothetical protein
MLGNQCERDENTFRIYGNNKNSEDPTLPTIPKGKKLAPWCMMAHLIGHQEFLCLFLLFTILGLG